MNLVPVPFDGRSRLEPGTYFLELDAPAEVLDAVVRNPDAARAVVRFLVDQSGASVTFAGGGVAWSRASGQLRRVYSMRLEVADGGHLPVLEAGIGGRALALLALAIGSAAATYGVWRLALYRLDPADIPGVVEDVRDTARAAATASAWVVFGTIAVGGYLIARAQGWLR